MPAIFYRIFGHSYVPVILFNLILFIVTSYLSMHLAEIWFGRRVAAITGFLLALWPSQIQFITVLASEQVFIVLTLVTLTLWANDRINLWLKAVIIGGVLAAASYVRPTALLIPVLFLLMGYANKRGIVRRFTAIFVMFIVMALLIAPWSIRNTQAFGQFTLISTNGGANLWMGNNPATTGAYMDLPAEVSHLNEAQRDTYLKSRAVAYIKEKPHLFAVRALRRVIDTYSRESIGVEWNAQGLSTRYGQWVLVPLKIINQIYWIPVLGLSLTGFLLLRQRYGFAPMLVHPLSLFLGYFTAIPALTVSQDRYHFPSIPLISILAAFTLIYLLDTLTKHTVGKAAN